MKTNRRWLKSAILAASREEIMLPWARKRLPLKTAKVIKMTAAAKPRGIAIAAA